MKKGALVALGLLVLGSGAGAYALSGTPPDAARQPAAAAHDPYPPPAGKDPRPTLVRAGISVVGRFDVFEHTFVWKSARYRDPWEQVDVEMMLRAPGGRSYQVGGFYYGPNRWKVRFAPDRVGRWFWRAVLTDGRRSDVVEGSLDVRPSGSPGFVRRSPYNRFRWVFSDLTPYYPIGIQDCTIQLDHRGSPLAHWGLDGGFRPPGVHTNGRMVDMDTYMRAYARAGVNLFRWSVDNCSFNLFQRIDPGGNVYSNWGGLWGDELVRHLRRHGFRVYMTLFNRPPFAQDPTAAQLAAVDRYVKYVVDRYGAYVDFWELMNESTASDSWYRQVGGYLHRIDPYHHPVSTSWEEPSLPVIDINSPHWYETESEFASDADAFQRILGWARAGKPVIVGEQGNNGQNWDPRSAVRMRLRAWSAFFAQGVLIFWNASFAKDDQGMAIYLGPEERQYLQVLQDFTTGFDPRARVAALSPSDPSVVRGYALRGPRTYAAYLVNHVDHTDPTAGISVRINPLVGGPAEWVDPSTGTVLRRLRLGAGDQTVNVPPFITDVALKVN